MPKPMTFLSAPCRHLSIRAKLTSFHSHLKKKTARDRGVDTRAASEKSIAEADLTLHEGDLAAKFEVQLGSVRAQEVRSMLRNAGERERQAFFEQLAMRIFPGATSVTGIAAHENDPEQPLKLSIRCTVPQFMSLQSGATEMNQLAPALGLADVVCQDAQTQVPALY